MSVAHCHTRDFDVKPVTPFSRAVNTLQPGAGGRSIVKLLDGKAKRTAVLNWHAGRRHAPQWALQLLARKIRERSLSALELANQLDAQKERPGLSAGALNLRKYHANKNR
jgi:hypothetical protein